MHKVELSVWEGKNELWNGVSRTPLEIGRQQESDTGPLELQDLVTCQRLVIAPLSARAIPRQALRVESPVPGTIRICNIHPRLSFFIGTEARPLLPGEIYEATEEIIVSLPENRTVRFAVYGSKNIETPITDPPDEPFRTIQATVDSTMESVNAGPVRLGQLMSGGDSDNNGRVAVDLVRSALTVVRQAAGSNEFFEAAVQSIASMVDLDRALALVREGNEWKIRAVHSADQSFALSSKGGTVSSAGGTVSSFSQSLLARVLKTGKTVVYDPKNFLHTTDSSIMALDRAVAAPILDENSNVIGALYGDRRFGSSETGEPIGDLEAALIEVMAGAVSSGLARQRQEKIRSSLTQFFSAAVAERLEQDNDLLSGRDAEVTVLFCDIRGFSTISERVGPKRTIEWINDVLTELSECVMDTDGVLVDYVGDELMAMWGAPAEQPDHAVRACRAATEMLSHIDPLRDRWKDITPDKFGFGIGISTGIARVGNTGSKVKFKYGPLGNTVNLASRVQGITKKLGVAALMTDATARAVGAEFDHRRLAIVRPVGIVEPVLLHELRAGADESWRSMSKRYESALDSFASGDLTGAARLLASLVHEHPDDNPSVVLLGRVVDALTKRDQNVDPVWTLDSK